MRNILYRGILPFIAILILSLPAWSVTTAYYSTLDNKSGATLVSALTTLTHGKYSGVMYGSSDCTDCVWGAYETTDVYPSSSPYAGKIWEIYAGCTNFTRSNQGSSCSVVCGTKSDGNGCGYNREHSLPKSWFGISSSDINNTSYRGPGVDIHPIYPTDVNVNTKRSNNPYGVVGSPTYTSPNGCKKGNCTWPSGYTGTAFEPADEYKGDLARSYLYMIVTWNAYNTSTYSFTQDADGNGAVTFNDNITAAGHFGLTDFGLELLLTWHRNDPVSQKEIDRNNAVEAVQGNRNPFIDYPCLVEYIWGEHAGETFTRSSVLGSFESGFTVGTSDGCYSGTDPVITSPKGMIDAGTTKVSTPITTQVTLTGLNLTTGNLSLNITGTNAPYFSVSPASVSRANALAGTTLTITYTPAAVGNHTATLSISGCGLSSAHTVTLTGTCVQTYTATWISNGAAYHSNTAISGTSPEVPEAPDVCDGLTFVGWTTHNGYNSTSVPDDLFTTAAPPISSNTTFYAVFASSSDTGTPVLTNNYARITMLNELTSGNYLIVGYNSGYYAMSTTWKSTYYLAPIDVTPINDVISNPDASIIWAITKSNNQVTIQNGSDYLYIEKSGNYYNIKLGDNTSSNKYTYTVSDGSWTFTSTTYTDRLLEYYIDKTRWAFYTSTDAPVYLYQQQTSSIVTIYSTTSTCQCTVTAVSEDENKGTANVAISE